MKSAPVETIYGCNVIEIFYINVVQQQNCCYYENRNRFVWHAVTCIWCISSYRHINLTLIIVTGIVIYMLLVRKSPSMVAELSIITSATSGTTTKSFITPLKTDTTTPYADIGTSETTFSTAPSATAGNSCQLDFIRPTL